MEEFLKIERDLFLDHGRSRHRGNDKVTHYIGEYRSRSLQGDQDLVSNLDPNIQKLRAMPDSLHGSD